MPPSNRALERSLKLKLRYFSNLRSVLDKVDGDDTLVSETNVTGLGFIFGTTLVVEENDTTASSTAGLREATVTKTDADDRLLLTLVLVFNDAFLTKTDASDTLTSLTVTEGTRLVEATTVEEDDTLEASKSDGIIATMEATNIVPGPIPGLIEGPVGSWQDNTAPVYGMSSVITPPDNCLLMLVLSQTFPSGAPGTTTITDNTAGFLSWTNQYTRESTNSPTGDKLKTTIWTTPVGTVTDSANIVINSTGVIGSSVWKFMYITDYEESAPFRQFSTNVASGTACTSGPIGVFSEATYGNSLVFGLGSIMGDSVNLVDGDMSGGDWTYYREFERDSQISETDSSTYQVLVYNTNKTPNNQYAFDNMSGPGLRDFHTVFFEISPPLINYADDTLDSQFTFDSFATLIKTEAADTLNASIGVSGITTTLFEDFASADLGDWTPAVSNFHFTEEADLFTRGVGEPDRFVIVPDPEVSGNKLLRVKYDAGTRGSNTAKPGDVDGSDIMVWHSGIDSSFNTYKELELEYRIKFGNSSVIFNFGRGGKLPGLAVSSNVDSPAGGYASAGDPNSYARNGTGPSFRHMWLEFSISSPNTIMDCFLADMDIAGSNEEHIRFNTTYPTRLRADATEWNPYGATSNSIVPNQWYTVKQYIKMNTVEANGFVNNDGILREYIDGQLAVEMLDCRFISNNNWGANLFVFSTFFGGSSDPADGYLTTKDEYTFFDYFKIDVYDTTFGDGYIYLSNSVIDSLATSGSAYDNLIVYASNNTVTANIADQDNKADTIALAKGLAYAKTNNLTYRSQAESLIMSAIGTEDSSTDALALSRNLYGYVIAADFIGLSGANNVTFTNWLRTVVDESYGGRTVRTTHADRPNNWGTMAGSSRLAAAIYTGNTAEIATCAQIFEGWLGNTAAYTFDLANYGGPDPVDLSWQADPLNPVGINPQGSTISGFSVDGVLPDDQRRGGSFTWPPPAEEYVYEALQGAVTMALLLERQGYDPWNWENQALLRAFQWITTYPNSGSGYVATGDDAWMTYVINAKYGTSFTTSTPVLPGKQNGYADWTHPG